MIHAAIHAVAVTARAMVPAMAGTVARIAHAFEYMAGEAAAVFVPAVYTEGPYLALLSTALTLADSLCRAFTGKVRRYGFGHGRRTSRASGEVG